MLVEAVRLGASCRRLTWVLAEPSCGLSKLVRPSRQSVPGDSRKGLVNPTGTLSASSPRLIQSRMGACSSTSLRDLIIPLGNNRSGNLSLTADLWPQLFSDVSCIALWISSEKILTRLYSVLHRFHKRLEVNVKKPREKRCFQTIIVFLFGSVDNSNKCTLLWKIAARLIAVSTSVNNEMWVKLSAHSGVVE